MSLPLSFEGIDGNDFEQLVKNFQYAVPYKI